MNEKKYRIEKDSLGEIKIPEDALYGPATQRALENFTISDLTLPRSFIRGLGLVKCACAKVNGELGLLEKNISASIQEVAFEVAEGRYDEAFCLDIFQTGSATSTHMNANEVIASIASRKLGKRVHPNDHVNIAQSSNDTIPTVIHVAACLEIVEELLPALEHLAVVIVQKGATLQNKVKTGRTHLMDAMPLTYEQELGAWAAQIRYGKDRIEDSLNRLTQIAQGGTAVGSGINAPSNFGGLVAKELTVMTAVIFSQKENLFEGISSQDAVVEMSGQLKVLAVSLMKIANDLRWMNSGPISGLNEISIPALQAGSSIMPGKVNPVIPEAVAMVCAQVIGNDTTITIAGQSGNFQLNVMLPIMAYNILQNIQILSNACRLLADKTIIDFEVNENTAAVLEKNPILVTALNNVIGYEKGTEIAKKAYLEKRPILEVAMEETNLSEDELKQLLDPLRLTKGGI